MKKIFTLIAFALSAIVANADDIIRYEAAAELPAGVTVTGNTKISTVKIHSNKDEVDCIQFSSGYTTDGAFNSNAIVLAPAGGLKTGDVIKFAGFFNNSDDTKKSAIDIFTLDGTKPTVLFTSAQFINGRTSADDPVVETYTLTADVATLYIGRNGNTGTNIYSLIVSREAGQGGGENEPTGAKEVMDVASEAMQTIINASIANPIALTDPNFFMVTSDKKVYPMGTNDSGSVDVLPSDGEPVSLNTYIWEYNSGNVAFKAVSTPNADASANESWQKKNNGSIAEDGSWTGNEVLDVEGCEPSFLLAFGPKNGNPTASYKDYYEYNSDGGLAHRVYDGPYWTPGCGWAPVKGCFYEITPSVNGSMKLAIWIANCNNAQLYILNKTDNTLVENNAIEAKGFLQNKNFMIEQGWPTNVVKFQLNSDNKLVTAVDKDGVTPTPDATPQGRKFQGYLTFNVEANKTYQFFSPKMQPAIFGYEFTANETDGIENVAVAPAAKITKTIENGKVVIKNGAKTFNVAGQLVK